MPDPLTNQEEKVLVELTRLAGGVGRQITAKQLRDADFAQFVFAVMQKDVAYPDAQQSRLLQTLRDKGYITMRRGVYLVLATP